MLQRLREARHNQDGFTLIELLIVIVILGILAGIVVFGVAKFRSDSTLAACKADLKIVDTASQAYNAQNGSYTGVATLVTDKYLKAAPPATEGISVTVATGDVVSTMTGCTL
jgi:prepilin-type N-terminal cleavage/methylation domain-containing protein